MTIDQPADTFSWEIDPQDGQVRIDFSGGSTALNVVVILDPDAARAFADELTAAADTAEENI